MTLEPITGKVLRIVPQDADTDEVISGKYKYDELDLSKLTVRTFESIDPDYYTDSKHAENPIIVTASNFGCGSSREQAPQVIAACGVGCAITESFACIVYRNGFNIGLSPIECSGIAEDVHKDDELRIDFENGSIANVTTGAECGFSPIPKFMQELRKSGGLLKYLKENGGYE
ncbi:MAG: 3-isopropylmalate dehydratase [Candidatus Methanogaster sp.]|uniref:3-isopropylmalate dehydratase n=1 Tax=Candidatus Methanogaster sp. TaxID=3386292 RepID=A0AC61L427_9EURY|nr:MAG: 3-isopropylmalate dehydratase [ANME-2 cluster archaeon]